MYKGACVYMNSSYEMIECTICHGGVLHKDLSNHVHHCLECGWRIDQYEKSKRTGKDNWQIYHESCPVRNVHTGKVFVV